MASGVPLTGASDEDVHALAEQNRQLIQQVNTQQKQIDELRTRLDRLEPAGASNQTASAGEQTGRQIRLSGEAAVGFFHSGREGGYPNANFRVDEAKLFIEAPVWKNAYFFGGLELATREAGAQTASLGELYLDVENLAAADRTHTLSLRAGRFNIPFGEEYQVRNVVDNPLVSHSLADLWGFDTGVQIYGALGPVKYNLAVQNGWAKPSSHLNSDKAVTMRLAMAPTPYLRLSASAMRTGKLEAAKEGLSEIWFANTFFRAIGLDTTTQDLFRRSTGVGRHRTLERRTAQGYRGLDQFFRRQHRRR